MDLGIKEMSESKYLRLLIVILLLAIEFQGLSMTKALQNSDSKEIKLLDDFPSPVKFRHLGDWQRFDVTIVNATAIKLLSLRSGVLVPDFAESWSVSSDGKEIQFNLRKNVVFEDGSPITSKDAAFAINRHISLKGQNALLLEKILQKIPKEGATLSSQYFVDARQPDLLVIRLNDPYPDFLGIVAMLSFSIFKEEDLSPKEDLILPKFKASGPYKLKSISQQKVVLEKNLLHWNKELLSKIPQTIDLENDSDQSISKILDGRNDVTRGPGSSFDRLALEKKGLQFVRAGLAQTFLVPDFKGPTLSKHPELMKIIHVLLDRDQLILDQRKKGHFDSKGINALTADIGKIEEEFNIQYAKLRKDTSAEAKSKLKQITTAMKSNGVKLSMAVRNSSKYYIDLGESIIQQLESLGIPVEKTLVPTTELTKNENFGKYDLRPLAEMWDTSRPSVALKYILNTNPKATNIASNHEVFRLVNSSVNSYDEHVQQLRAFNQIVLRDGLLIPIHNLEIFLVFSPRIDPSRVPINDLTWYPQDLSFKAQK
jgi:ABC-type transport system substrate-binding protein